MPVELRNRVITQVYYQHEGYQYVQPLFDKDYVVSDKALDILGLVQQLIMTYEKGEINRTLYQNTTDSILKEFLKVYNADDSNNAKLNETFSKIGLLICKQEILMTASQRITSGNTSWKRI